MIRKVNVFFYLIISVAVFLPCRIFSQIPTKVFEITSILVDGCAGSLEGQNEMVLFQIGPSPVNAADLRVDGAPASGIIATGLWPTASNPWLGIAAPPAKPTEIASINSTIICNTQGILIEPTGGILPAGKNILMITSTDFDPAAYDFSDLTDTLYVIFQNAGNTAGHFVNFGASSTRTLVLVHVPTFGADTIIYDRSFLTMQNGTIGAQDGGAVNYTYSGMATYFNNGCKAPYTPLNPAWTDTTVCQLSSPLDLNILITGTAGGAWSGTSVAGNLFDPLGLNGNYPITYTVGNSPCLFTETHNITVDPAILPAFTALGPYCIGATPGTLSTTSDNGITGTWNPATISTGANGTSTYIFTPTAGQCATTASMSVTVGTNITPTFTPLGPYCVGATPGTLPSISDNGINGTWNPSAINTGTVGTATYTFTPTVGQCAITTTMSVTVSSSITPTFTALGPYCMGDAPDALPASSTNGFTGTWNPSTISTAAAGTTVYTFTPAVGQCSVVTTMPVTVNANITPTFTALGPYCTGSTPDPLLSTSTNGIAGTWNPSTISTAAEGTTTYTFTPTAGQCATITTLSVTVNTNPALTTSETDEHCGISDGTVTVNTSGSCSAAYNYLWNTGDNTQTVINLPAGAYTVTVSCGSCTATASVTVNNISGPSINIDLITSANCNASDGGVNISVSGGTSPYSFSWNSAPPQITQNLQNVPAGNYIVTVTDASGCSSTATTTVNNISGPIITVLSENDTHCGQTNGSVQISVSGGATPYTFSWNSVPVQTTQDLQNVVAGNYSVTVTDALGCIAIADVVINDIPGPAASIFSVTNADCGASDGAVTVNVAGGTPPLTYLWNSIPPQTTQNLTNVPVGIYSLTVTDSAGCMDSISVTVDIGGGLALSSTGTDEMCGQMNGTVSVSVTGGSGNYTYSWNTLPSQTTSAISGLTSGNYIVTVSDGTCTAITEVAISNYPGPDVYITVQPRSITLFDGPVSITGNSDGQIVNWEWSLGDGSSASGQAVDHEYGNTGTYYVTLTATDANGCVVIVTDSVVVNDIYTLYIPNTFTPDDDGKNDLFMPAGVNVDTTDFYMSIYDRWGELIFETKKWGEGWNGTKYNLGTRADAIQDVYVYRVVAHKVNGRVTEYIGKVTIMK